jgi:hypothetical protein
MRRWTKCTTNPHSHYQPRDLDDLLFPKHTIQMIPFGHFFHSQSPFASQKPFVLSKVGFLRCYTPNREALNQDGCELYDAVFSHLELQTINPHAVSMTWSRLVRHSSVQKHKRPAKNSDNARHTNGYFRLYQSLSFIGRHCQDPSTLFARLPSTHHTHGIPFSPTPVTRSPERSESGLFRRCLERHLAALAREPLVLLADPIVR